MSERVSGALRLRSAGFGVIVGGAFLLFSSFFLSAVVASGTLVVLALGMAVGGRENGTWWIQLCLGIGAVGAIGLVETATGFGLGLDALEIGAIAVVFGTFDVVAGTIIHRFRPRADQ